jgi:phosphoribosylformylglycinamidine cyclo-ligase
VKGLAHITGGGITGNVPRALPENTVARIRKDSWPRPPVVQWLQRTGNVAEDEMFRVFNCGVGMVVVLAPSEARRAAELLRAEGETVYEIGAIDASSGEPDCLIV